MAAMSTDDFLTRATKISAFCFMATSLGNLIAGLVGGDIDPAKLDLMPQLFNRTAMSLFAVAALFAVLIVPIRNMMRTSTAQDH